MFFGCSSLIEINLSEFYIYNVMEMNYMFSGCSDEFKKKIKTTFKNIRDEAFDEKIKVLYYNKNIVFFKLQK